MGHMSIVSKNAGFPFRGSSLIRLQNSIELGLLPHHHHHRAPLREVVDGAAAAERAAIMSRRRSAQSLVNQAAGPSRVYSGNACIYMPAASSQLS